MKASGVIRDLSEFLSAEGTARITAVQGHTRAHPVSLLLQREDGGSQHRANVDEALRRVSVSNPHWLQKMKPRILSEETSEAAATLAELRAYGALLSAGFTVTPVPTSKGCPTPEFAISDGNSSAVVEVHAKQVNDSTERELLAMRKKIAEDRPDPGKIKIHEQVVHPWGRPIKRSDSTTLNAISKVCAIKCEERQLQSNMPSIIWMDFQDLYSWDLALTPDQFQPLLSWNERITSGVLWYALYAWKGAPVFESLHYSHLDLPSQIQRMEHNGRFLISTLASAVVISLPTVTVIAETPRKARQLSSDCRFRLLGLPHAELQYSRVEWSTDYLATVLESDARMVCGMVKEVPPASYVQFIRDLPPPQNE